MFKKILIANRGEIACRIIRTARAMGLGTVAVYSEADRDALHVEMADEAVCIGPAPSAQSYLQIDRILDACRATGADAVHPGYGFLSERVEFAEALAAAGIAFIGPNPRAIAAMGDKIESKKLAQAAGVSTVPGYIGEIRDEDHAREIARGIGFPVMVKASAGGGGKGLRIVHHEDELSQAIQSSQNEARASFGDDRLFIEKFVTEPRHIEIQVLGDKHGQVIWLGERECSIQRRHQKVIEEAPSPFLDARTRKAMGEQAVALAQAVGYDSAGTVEFIVDKDRNFYFLEMNTRLQVEHPVTELVTGIDLVEMMIRSAAGEKLSLRQSDIALKGWAIEARIYAEDPYRGFLPSTGRLVKYRPPAETREAAGTVRNDTGVFEGGEISIYYDPMIAKLCSHASTRAGAIALLADALDRFEIKGINHNIPFLSALLGHARFQEGRLTTGFIAEEYPDGFHGAPMRKDALPRFALAAVAAELMRANRLAAGFAARYVPAAYSVTIGDDSVDIAQARIEAGAMTATLDGKPVSAEIDWAPGRALLVLRDGAGQATFSIQPVPGGFRLAQGGTAAQVLVRRPQVARLAANMPHKPPPDMSRFLLCPMPGLVVSVNVSEGQEVKTGEVLAVIEAMKMENVLLAERDGKIKKVNAGKGDSLALDEVILEFA